MPLEDLTGPDKFPDALVRDWPLGADIKSEGDDHLRGVKNVIKNTFPNIDGIVARSQDELNTVIDKPARAELVGMIATFPLAGLPAGWFTCAGALLLVADYPTLGAYLGTAYGGDGVTDFGLPDYRGEFIRMRDGAAGRNPDGDLPEGTRQAESTLAHDHAEQGQNSGAGAAANINEQGSDAPSSVTFLDRTELTGGNETRARNITVNFAIYAGPVGT